MAKYVKVYTVANATSYELHAMEAGGSTLLATETVTGNETEFNFNLDELKEALNLSAGTYTLAVKAKAEGYEDSEFSDTVTYVIEEAEATWEVYSQDNESTVSSDENGVPTVTVTSTNKALVLMKNTNKDFSFKAPAESQADGGRMVIVGRYDNNVLAIRPRGDSVGTNLQRYDYTTFGGGVLTTDSSAVNTFAENDVLSVSWSGSTVTLKVNGVEQSSFDCSSYMSNETWKKCAGFMYTNLNKSSFTLSNFTLN